MLDALLTRSLAEAESAFADLDLESGPAREALDRLLHAPWLLGRYRGLYAAATRHPPPATRHLGPAKVRQLHDRVFKRIEAVIERGRAAGDFRTDLPLDWLVSVIYALAHAAVTEVDTGQFAPAQAADLLSTTLLDLLQGPKNG